MADATLTQSPKAVTDSKSAPEKKYKVKSEMFGSRRAGDNSIGFEAVEGGYKRGETIGQNELTAVGVDAKTLDRQIQLGALVPGYEIEIEGEKQFIESKVDLQGATRWATTKAK